MTTTTDARLIRYRQQALYDALSNARSLKGYYGCKGDGVTDDSDRIEAALYDAAERNGVILVDDAEFLCERKIEVQAANPFGMIGRVLSAFSFVNPDSCGFDIQMPYPNSSRHAVKTMGVPTISGFKLLKKHTENVYSGQAFKLMFAGNPVGVETTRPGFDLIISDIEMITHPAIVPATARQAAWLNGLYLGRLSLESGDMGGGATIHASNINFCGPLPPDQTSQPYGGVGILLDTATGSKLSHLHIRRAGIGLEAVGLTEGPSISDSNFVACDWGVKAGSSSEPHLTVDNCHFNTFSGGVWAVNRDQGFISGCLFYQRPSSNTEEFAYIKLDGGQSWHIHHNTTAASSLSNNPDHVVRFLDITDTSMVNVDHNIVRSCSHFVRIAGTSTNVQIPGSNNTSQVPVAIEDTSTGASNGSNYYHGRRSAAGAYITASMSSSQSIPDDTETDLVMSDAVTYAGGGALTLLGELRVEAKSYRVRVTANVKFSENSTGYREVTLLKNGVALPQFSPVERRAAVSGGDAGITLITAPIPVEDGDRFKLSVRQDSGGSLDVLAGSWMCMEVIA